MPQARFNIPFSSVTEISENNFIRFSNIPSDKKINQNDNLIDKKSFFKMDFNLDLNKNAEVQLIYNEKIGDIIKGVGKGSLKLEIDENGKFKMYGDVLIEE